MEHRLERARRPAAELHSSLIPIFLLLVLVSTTASAISVEVESRDTAIRVQVSLSQAEVAVTRQGDFDRITIEGALNPPETPRGAPLLPQLTFFLALPEGKTLGESKIDVVETEWFDAHVIPHPASDPDFPSDPYPPDSSIYDDAVPYPPSLLTSAHTGWCRGLAIGTVTVSPLRYFGAERALQVCTSLVIDIDLVPETADARAIRAIRHPSRRSAQDPTTVAWLRRMVANPEAVSTSQNRNAARAPSRQAFGGFQPTEFPSPDGSPVEYVIVTDDVTLDGRPIGDLTTVFEELADWKVAKGTPAVVRTMSWVRENFAGHDDPDKLRNFLKAAYELWGTDYVLLGGDLTVVPARRFNGLNLGNGDPPAEVYFGGLDNDWDLDDDGLYGELFDAGSSDPYWDLWIGRAPVETVEEAEVFVHKTLSYSRVPGVDVTGLDPSYYDRTTLLAGLTNCADWEEVCNGLFVAETIVRRILPPSMNFERIYQKLLDPSPGCTYHETFVEVSDSTQTLWTTHTAMGALNTGAGFVHHFEHSNPYTEGGSTNYGYGCSVSSGGALGREFIDQLDNGPNWSIVYSTGAAVHAFDYDSVSEHWLLNPNGGAVAYIGKTRSGGGNSYVTGAVDTLSFEAMFQHGATMGQTLAFATQSVQYSVNRAVSTFGLLGDPELQPFTTLPRSMNLDLSPVTPGLGDQVITVTLTDAFTQAAIVGGRVAIAGDDDLYAYGSTGTDGSFEVAVTLTSEAPLTVTASARNYLPLQQSIEIGDPPLPHLVYAQHQIVDDSLTVADGDGVADAGELLEILTTLENHGGNFPGGTVTLAPIGAVVWDITVDGNCDPASLIVGGAGMEPGSCELSFPNLEYSGIDPHGRPQRLVDSADPGLFVWREGSHWTVVSRGLAGPSPPETVYHAIVQIPGGVSGVVAGALETGDSWSITTEGLEFEFTVDDDADHDSLSFQAREESWIAIDSTTAPLDAILAGSSTAVPFPVHLLGEIADGHVPRFELVAREFDGDASGRSSFEVPISAPDLEYVLQTISVDGETVTISPTVRNSGGGSADDVELLLTLVAGTATVTDSVVSFGTLASGAEAGTTEGFALTTDDTSSPRFQITLSCTLPDGSTRTWVHESGELIAPCAPSGLSVEITEGRSAQCFWQAPSAGCAPDLLGYHVYRRLAGEPDFSRVYSAAADGTQSFMDRGLPTNTAVEYAVGTVDSARNESALSAIVANHTWRPELPGWPRQIDAGTFGSPTLIDLDGNGSDEVLVLGNALYGWYGDATPLVPGSDGTVFRPPRPFDVMGLGSMGAFSSTPGVADLDNDGQMEIVVSAWDDSLWVVRPDGELLWGRYSQSKYSSPALGDVDGDGDLEVVVGSDLPQVYAWHHDGSPVIPGNPDGILALLPDGARYNYASPALVDIDGDPNTKEVVFATYNGNVYAWDKDATLLWSRSVGPERPLSTPALGDIDSDGVTELVVAQGSRHVSGNQANLLVILNAQTGQLEKTWGPSQLPGGLHSSSNIIHAPALADLDGDHDLEIVVATEGGVPPVTSVGATVLLFDHDGDTYRAICQDVLPQPGLNTSGQRVNAQPIVADLDGDGTLEVFAGSTTFGLFMFDTGDDCNGEIGWPLLFGGEIDGAPAVGDIDGDGYLDFVVRGSDDWVHAFSLETPFDPGTIHWGQHGHDPRNTSVYTTPNATELVVADVVPTVLSLEATTPNPSSNHTVIRFGLSGRGHARLRIYGVDGRLVRILLDDALAAGLSEVTWDGRDSFGRKASSGTYFYRLEVAGQSLTRKLVLLH